MLAVKGFFKTEARKRAFNGGGIRNKRMHAPINTPSRIGIERKSLTERRNSIQRNRELKRVMFRLCMDRIDP